MNKTEAAETARKALEILDRDGWNKGAVTMSPAHHIPGYREGSHCIGGAWNLALWGEHYWDVDHPENYAALISMLKEQFPENYEAFTLMFEEQSLSPWDAISMFTNRIAWWNNHPDTTEADVRMILEKIAAGG